MSEYLAMSCDDVEWGGCENHNGGRGRLPLGYVSNRVGGGGNLHGGDVGWGVEHASYLSFFMPTHFIINAKTL